jgi:hypothetical protein
MNTTDVHCSMHLKQSIRGERQKKGSWTAGLVWNPPAISRPTAAKSGGVSSTQSGTKTVIRDLRVHYVRFYGWKIYE